MPFATILDRIGDAVNPIVVKELRQAVQSRFVVAMLLVFLFLQLLSMAVYLVVVSLNGSLYASDFEAGRGTFGFLHGVLLVTCMLCIPAYSGFRLAAEHSEVHIDLFYISTLRPRAIVAGKFAAALLLAILIFSACTPFMTFTYYLRGIDIGSILFMIGMDFLVAAMATMVALFVAVVPANRVLKVLLALGSLLTGVVLLYFALILTVFVLDDTLAANVDSPEFWVGCLVAVLETIGFIVFLFTCSVGLLSPPSANRTLSVRLGVALVCLATAPPMLCGACWIDAGWPMVAWVISAGVLVSLGLLIAVNEREHWAPRLARTIPRRLWLRPVAFVSCSGAAGGVLWALLLGLVCLVVLPLAAARWPTLFPCQAAAEAVETTSPMMAIMFAYTYCYGLTAVFLRNTLIKLPPICTWVLALALLALGSSLPYLVTFLVHFDGWSFWDLYPWLLTDPVAGMIAVGKDQFGAGVLTMIFTGCWALLVTVLNGPWMIRQMRRFHPHAATTGSGGELLRTILSATPMDTTRTARRSVSP